MFTQADVFKRVRLTLQDPTGARWPLSNLNLWLNDGVREIAFNKPNTTSDIIILTLVSGVNQALPDTHFQFLSAIRNMTGSNEATATGLDQVSPVAGEIIDAMTPGWTSTAVLPFSAQVQHVIFNPANQNEFMVYPGNDGTGFLEVEASKVPLALADGPSDDIDTWTAPVLVKDVYQQALVDYVTHRAFEIDMAQPGIGARSQGHYQKFAAALGIKLQGEMVANPNTSADGEKTR